MPDPSQFSSRDEFMAACVPERRREHPDETMDQSVAVCSSMWDQRGVGGTGKISKTGTLKADQEGVGPREAVFVASTNSVDRAGDIVEQNWDLRSFRKNPVFAFSHATRDLPVGRVRDIWTDKQKIRDTTFIRAEAPPEGMDAFADRVWRFIKSGFLSAVSVGFRPIERPIERTDKKGRYLGLIFPKNELFEVSVVPVPANQEALIVARSFGLTDKQTREIFFSSPGDSTQALKRFSLRRAAQRRAEIERLRLRT